MYTLNSLLNCLGETGKLDFCGESYDDGKPVYSGDLWRIWPSADGLETKNQNRLASLMERKGMHLHFYDETINDDDGKVHRAQPGYYGDTLTWTLLQECVVWSRSMAEENPADYLDALMESGYRSADKWGIDFAQFGFERFDYSAESGLHAGQTDTPDKVAELVKDAHGADCDIVFSIDGIGQFDIHFSAWYRIPEKED